MLKFTQIDWSGFVSIWNVAYARVVQTMPTGSPVLNLGSLFPHLHGAISSPAGCEMLDLCEILSSPFIHLKVPCSLLQVERGAASES